MVCPVKTPWNKTASIEPVREYISSSYHSVNTLEIAEVIHPVSGMVGIFWLHA